MTLKHRREQDTLVAYTSEDGEKIEVISGPVKRTTEERKGFTVFSTRVYAQKGKGRRLEAEFGEESLNREDIPLITPKLRELADGRAPLDELLAALRTMEANIAERNQMKIDEGEIKIDEGEITDETI